MGCMLCPRRCGAPRETGARGFCGADDRMRIARAALHFWEEPCVSGKNGTGAVFFSGCNLNCVFCQNREISRGESGIAVSIERLTDIFFELKAQGAQSIDLVTPTHYTDQVIAALEAARLRDLELPVVWNSSCYENAETIRRLSGLVDVYMPDFKYVSSALSERCSGAPDYFSAASKALAEMVRQRPYPIFSGDRMTAGVLVRHLVLPGCTEDSKAVLKYLYETYGDDIYISIMCQYTPPAELPEHPELLRKVSDAEYREVVAFAEELGIENGFTQTGEAVSESFIPAFDHTGVLPAGGIE